MGRPLDAITTLQTVLAAASGKVDAGNVIDVHDVHYRLGLAYMVAEQLGEAVREFKTVLQGQPQYVDAHLYLANLYVRQRQLDRAWLHARQAESLGAPVADLITLLQRVAPEPQ